MKLPEEFISRMNDFFENNNVSKDGFFESFDKEPLKGIRINRMKTSEDGYVGVLDSLGVDGKKVSWCDGGFYSTIESSGKDPYYHCGVYYPTEPSAMLPAQTLNAKPGEIVLDLCAAPGGKTYHIADLIHNTLHYIYLVNLQGIQFYFQDPFLYPLLLL